MLNSVSANWFQHMAPVTHSRSFTGQVGMPQMSGGMASNPAMFMMILNMVLQNVQSTQQTPPSGAASFFNQNPLQGIGCCMPQPMAHEQPVVAMAPATEAIKTKVNSVRTAELSFKPMQFIKLEGTFEGKLKGTAQHFINAGKKYDIDPGLLSAIAIHETGNGSSRAANEKNNIAGMMGKNGLRSYASVEESTFDMARNLRQNYLNQGKETIAAIGAKYAPIGAANDPTGLNNHWTKGVTRQFNNLT